MKNLLNVVSLIFIYLIVGCATTKYESAGQIESAKQLLHKGDFIRVVKTNGKQVEFVFIELKEDGIYGFNDFHIPRKEISRIEVQRTTQGVSPAHVGAAAVIIVVLPFMIVCSVLTGNNSSSGPCAWGH